MKKNKLFAMMCCLALTGFLFAGCDQNLPEIGYVGVERIDINDAQLAIGATLEAEKTLSIARKVVLTPANATDRAENYSSDNPSIATVDERGLVTGVSAGQTKIHIHVGGKSVGFDLKVTPKIIYPATDLVLPATDLPLQTTLTYDLRANLTLTPANANDGLIFSSDDESVVTVSEKGILTGVGVGTATITVKTVQNEIEKTMTVTVTEFSGWYPRNGWSMAFSHPLAIGFSDANQSELAALDDNTTTRIALVKPGFNQYGVSVGASDEIWFVVDMKQSQKVNAFQIVFRSGLEHLRWYGFDDIYGSNDELSSETNRKYDPISSNVSIPNAGTSLINEIRFLTAGKDDTPAYRYYKFRAQSASCFGTSGNTVQMDEFYLGLLE